MILPLGMILFNYKNFGSFHDVKMILNKQVEERILVYGNTDCGEDIEESWMPMKL